MSNPAQVYVELLQNPFVSKHYNDLARYYDSIGRIVEAKAIDDLVELRFGKTNCSNNHKE